MKEKSPNQISPSKDDYLRVLYDLYKYSPEIRSVEIARTMDVSLPSVSRAMKELNQGGYISKLNYGTINLTQKGIQAADKLKKRNDLLVKFLTQVLNVETSTAVRDACRIEHDISNETTNKMEYYIDSLIKCVNNELS